MWSNMVASEKKTNVFPRIERKLDGPIILTLIRTSDQFQSSLYSEDKENIETIINYNSTCLTNKA